MEHRADTLIAQMRSAGLRITRARRAIAESIVTHADDHLTAEELTAAVQLDDHDVHETTIYRTLNELERLGIVHHVHLGHGPAIHHLSDHNPHYHLVCTHCDRVVEVSPHAYDQLKTQLREQYRFCVDLRHFALTGACITCQPT